MHITHCMHVILRKEYVDLNIRSSCEECFNSVILRKEYVDLNVVDVSLTPEGYVVILRKEYVDLNCCCSCHTCTYCTVILRKEYVDLNNDDLENCVVFVMSYSVRSMWI